MSKRPPNVDKATLIAVTSIIAIGGVIYELMLSTATSFLIGDATKSYSLGVGLSLFGMGIGSLLATKLFKKPLHNFMNVELLLSLLGGTSVIILFSAYSVTKLYWVVFVLLSISIGILIGFEIPLVMETYKKLKKSHNVFLTRILAADYIGALIGSLLFPFILLPYLGLVRSALAMGLINVSVVILLLIRSGRKFTSVLSLSVAAVVVLLISLLIAATSIERALTTKNYQDQVIYYQTTEYQKIVVTIRQDDVRLYLNDQLQFSTRDEARYHETLVHSAMTQAGEINNVLILGGGDGLVAREVLKYPEVKSVTDVDIDPAMTKLAKDNWKLAEINQHSFSDSRVSVVNEDASQYLRNTSIKYDVIIADLVDPANDKIARLYGTDFYSDVQKALQPNGIFITQATSTYFSPSAFWIINNNVNTVFGVSSQLSVNVPSFGEWGFVISSASNEPTKRELPPTKFLTDETLAQSRQLSSELLQNKNDITSSVLSPKLHTAYNKDMSRWTY